MSNTTLFDYIIIGGGPAGLQLGYFLDRAGRNYCILERGNSAGTFFKTFPRHRKLISINKVYTGYEDNEINLRWDWNSLLSNDEQLLFKNYSKSYFPHPDSLVGYLNDFAEQLELNIRYNTRVTKVSRPEHFQVEDEQGNHYFAKRLIVATGVSKPYIPPIPGIELTENYVHVSVDPADFINQRVLIIGKGNSGFETADNLIETAALIHVASPESLKMAWRTHFVGNLRAVNNNILDTYQLKSQNAILDATIKRIARHDGKYVVTVSYAHAHNEQEELVYDRVITCTGFRFDDTIFDASCRPTLAIKERFPQQTSEWESVNVKDLYFAGTITQMRDYKKTTSGFIHGFRYNIQALHNILEQKYFGEEWPSRALDVTATALTDAVIQQVNRTSALWQQFGFLADLIVVDEAEQQAHYYETVPVDYIRTSAFSQHPHYYLITLEYGPNHDAFDPFNVTRIARDDIERAEQSNFLHPVIRRFDGHHLVAEHHIIEDLAAEWQEDVHIQPLLEFFHKELGKAGAQQLPAQPLAYS